MDKPYYIIIGRESNQEGLYKDYKVLVNTPKICGNETTSETQGFADLTINAAKNYYNSDADSWAQIESQVINQVGRSLTNRINCCLTGQNCLDCDDPETVLAALFDFGYQGKGIASIQNIGNSAGQANDPRIVNYASKTFTINDKDVVNIALDYENSGHLDSLVANGLTYLVFITDDDHVCNGYLDSISNTISKLEPDVVYLHHIYTGNKSLGDELVLSHVQYKEGNNKVLVLPILKALGAAAADAFIQAFTIYILDDDVASIKEAAQHIDGWSVAGEFLFNLFGVSENMIEVGLAASGAIGPVINNANNTPGYKLEDGVRDFSTNFALSYFISKASSGALQKRLSNLKTGRLFSHKALLKLRKLICNGASTPGLTRAYIKFNYALHRQRLMINRYTKGTLGMRFEEDLFDWKYKDAGYITTAHAYKGIDYMHESARKGISVKTKPDISTKSDLKTLINKNVVDLNEFLRKGKTNSLNSKKSWDIEEAEIVIIVPKDQVSSVQRLWIELEQNTINDTGTKLEEQLNENLSVVITSMEDEIGI